MHVNSSIAFYFSSFVIQLQDKCWTTKPYVVTPTTQLAQPIDANKTFTGSEVHHAECPVRWHDDRKHHGGPWGCNSSVSSVQGLHASTQLKTKADLCEHIELKLVFLSLLLNHSFIAHGHQKKLVGCARKPTSISWQLHEIFYFKIWKK